MYLTCGADFSYFPPTIISTLGVEWGVATQHGIQDDTQTPKVTFLIIWRSIPNPSINNLWCHVFVWSNLNIVHREVASILETIQYHDWKAEHIRSNYLWVIDQCLVIYHHDSWLKSSQNSYSLDWTVTSDKQYCCMAWLNSDNKITTESNRALHRSATKSMKQ